LKNILIPGIGYGRNARIFLEQGMAVTGIESFIVSARVQMNTVVQQDAKYSRFSNLLTLE